MSTSGDLDSDGTPEKIIVFNTNQRTNDGMLRELQIQKLVDGDFVEIFKTRGPVLADKAGGVMGDPFKGIQVNDGKVIISHSGGSNLQWDYEHQYALVDNNWKLLFASNKKSTPCADNNVLQFDIVSGIITYVKNKEVCKNGEFVKNNEILNKRAKMNMKEYPNFDRFNPGGNELRLPGVEETLYF